MSNWTKEQQAEHRALWVAALRSGRYRQTTGALHTETGYCCLGVACELAVAAGVPVEVTNDEFTDGILYDGESGPLPPAVQDWLGLSDHLGTLRQTKWQDWGWYHALTDLNDDAHYNFDQIADEIESGNVKLAE